MKNNEINKELSNQTHPDFDSPAKIAQDIIVKHEKQFRRKKWDVIISWSLLFISYMSIIIIELTVKNENLKDNPWIISAFIIFIASIPISIYMTISFYIRYKILNNKKIQMRLSNIEETLKKLAKEKNEN